MSDSYRRLLPAPTPPGSSKGSISNSSIGKEGGPPVKKRSVSKAACNNCRAKKIRCDGERPACAACSGAGVECNFVTANPNETPFMALKREVESLRRTTADMLELYDLLGSAPDEVCLIILRRLKSTANPSRAANDVSVVLAAIKREFQDGPIRPVELSNRQLMGNLIPQAQQHPCEFELMMRYSTTYTIFIPLEIAFVNLADLLRPFISEQPKLPLNIPGDYSQGNTPKTAMSDSTPIGTIAPTFSKSVSRQGDSEPIRSVHTLSDGRLERINIQKWTNVPIANDLAARLISLYLEIDHPWCPVFDADLFLDDCLQEKTRFCSRVLVSALLSWACQCYASIQPEAAPLAVAFEKEAEDLWAVERRNNTLTAAAASQLLSNAASSRGRDVFSRECLEDGIQMGKRMGLFGVDSKDASALTWLDHHQDWLKFACHTSWGVFICACIRSLHLHRAEIENPPLLPMPGDSFETHGEFDQSRARTLVSTNVGEIFRAMCELNLIVHDIVWTYFGKGDVVPAERATIEFAEQAYQRLFELAASLPLDLARGKNNQHATLMLHVYFHCTVMELSWPFLLEPSSKTVEVQSMKAAPKDIHAASVNQLKRLALIHRIDINQVCSATLWHIALLYLANAMLCESTRSKNVYNPEFRFYFMLCIAGYQNMW
ncbi:hypothetical protein F5B20DRAFT_387400 [Whalleya microplaca]|nr:hypothetical protein F5B20DRAFT_387400 [Whalleya microplaca]